MYNIYISCSYDMPYTPPEVKGLFKDYKGVDVKYFEKGTSYKKEYLEQSNAVIFVLPDMNWAWDISKLNRGVLEEFIHCLNTRKPVFIAYKTASGTLGVYPAIITDDLCIQGIAGSKDSIFRLIESNLLPQKPSSVVECSTSEELTNFETTY